jgi:kinetochore protein Nuf2
MKLMAASGIHDFGLKDIFKPEPIRLRIILSAIINFAKFREEKIAIFAEYVENTVRNSYLYNRSSVLFN